MSLTAEQEAVEYNLKVAQMEADIALKKADVVLKAEQTRKVKQDWRLDPQRVVIQAFIAGAAIVGAIGSATTVAAFFLGRASGH